MTEDRKQKNEEMEVRSTSHLTEENAMDFLSSTRSDKSYGHGDEV